MTLTGQIPILRPTMPNSNKRSIAVVAGLVTLWVACFATHAFAQQFAPEPAEGILLLQNGNLLKGRISRSGDKYTAEIDGGSIQVRSGEVAFFCRTLEEAYYIKKGVIKPGDVGEHLDLAQWCQRHGLLGCAIQELAQAKALDPTHPLIGLIERRVRISMSPPPVATIPSNSPSVAVENSVASNKKSPSPDDLDELVQGMPPGTMETFTQTIQPLLVRHCAAAGCHGPDSETGFRLQLPVGGVPTQRLTQRNLLGTLALVNRDAPRSSPLLTVPIQPHGPAKAPVFSDQQAKQYQQVFNWVYQLSTRPVQQSTRPVQQSAVAGTRQTGGPRDSFLPWQHRMSYLTSQAVETIAKRDSASRGSNSGGDYSPSDEVVRATFDAVQDNMTVLPKPGARVVASPTGQWDSRVNWEEPNAKVAQPPDASERTVQSFDARARAAEPLPSRERPFVPPNSVHSRIEYSNPDTGYAPFDEFDPELYNRRFFPPAGAVEPSGVAPPHFGM